MTDYLADIRHEGVKHRKHIAGAARRLRRQEKAKRKAAAAGHTEAEIAKATGKTYSSAVRSASE